MKSFIKWLKENKNQNFEQIPSLSNRTQPWGNSATFGQPSTTLPWQKITPAIAGGVGQGVLRSLGRSPSSVPNLELGPLLKKKESVDISGFLPLQLPPENMSGRINRRNLLNQVFSVLSGGDPNNDNRVRGKNDEENNKNKFRLPDQNNMDELRQAELFTQGLLWVAFYNILRENGLLEKVDWKKPRWHTEEENGYLKAIAQFPYKKMGQPKTKQKGSL